MDLLYILIIKSGGLQNTVLIQTLLAWQDDGMTKPTIGFNELGFGEPSGVLPGDLVCYIHNSFYWGYQGLLEYIAPSWPACASASICTGHASVKSCCRILSFLRWWGTSIFHLWTFCWINFFFYVFVVFKHVNFTNDWDVPGK